MKKILYILFLISMLSPFAEKKRRVVVLGFDGADPILIKKWMSEGKLPNLQVLSREGTFTSLETSNPAQSPVAWATFATGTNPGKHNIYGFLKRGTKGYKPELAVAKIKKARLLGGFWGRFAFSLLLAFLIPGIVFFVFYFVKRKLATTIKAVFILLGILVGTSALYSLLYYVPMKLPWPKSLKKGTSVWHITGENSVRTVILGAPIAFPAKKLKNGCLLCGFGVPDMAATNGLWFKYSEKMKRIQTTETGGWKIPLVKEYNSWKGTIIGPPNLLVKEEIESLKEKAKDNSLSIQKLRRIKNRIVELRDKQRLLADLFLSKQGNRLKIQIGQDTQELSGCVWSKWFTVPFSMSPLITLKGMIKLRVLSYDPLEVYMTPVQFHPQHIPVNVAISSPRDYASKIAQRNGLYPTLGWSEATNPLKDGEIDEKVFWEDLTYTTKQRTKILFSQMEKNDWQFFMTVFYATDRAGHMYWRFIDPKHPRYNDRKKYPKYKDGLFKIYKWMDDVVGKVRKKLSKEDILMVISDHGFASFRWEVNVNTWLYKHGYLSLKTGKRSRMQIIDLFRDGNLCKQIDWKRTKAYSIGLGKIYINLKGRDKSGIVPKSEYKKLCKEIREKFLRFRHNGKNVVSRIVFADEIYTGPSLNNAPDMLLGFHRGYRISWQTSLGGVPDEIIEPNRLKWSGDHCSIDPKLVPGVFFSNKKLINEKQPHLIDIAPTVLSLFHIKIPKDMEGKVIINDK